MAWLKDGRCRRTGRRGAGAAAWYLGSTSNWAVVLLPGHQGAAVQRPFLDELSAQNTLDGGTAKDSRFLDGFIVRAGDVLHEWRRFLRAPRRRLGPARLGLRAVG